MQVFLGTGGTGTGIGGTKEGLGGPQHGLASHVDIHHDQLEHTLLMLLIWQTPHFQAYKVWTEGYKKELLSPMAHQGQSEETFYGVLSLGGAVTTLSENRCFLSCHCQVGFKTAGLQRTLQTCPSTLGSKQTDRLGGGEL